MCGMLPQRCWGGVGYGVRGVSEVSEVGVVFQNLYKPVFSA